MNLLLLAVSVLTPGIIHFLIGLVVLLIICGLIAFLVSKAPWVAEPYKSVILWLLLVIPVVYIILFLLTFL